MTRALTYAELATLLGIAPDSAKRLALRRRWHKAPGNDGKVRVAVPLDYLDRHPDSRQDSPPDSQPDRQGDSHPDRFARLEVELAAVRARLDTAQGEREEARVELAGERQAVIHLRAELERRDRDVDDLRRHRDELLALLAAPLATKRKRAWWRWG